MSDDELLKYVQDFRRGLIGRRTSSGMCWATCAPLATVLRMQGVQIEMVEGTCGGHHHFYLQLPDGRIIDPTGDQFKALKLPKVYFGRAGRLYRRRVAWKDNLGPIRKIMKKGGGK